MPENSLVKGPRVQLSKSTARDAKEMERIQKLSGSAKTRAEKTLRVKRQTDRALGR